MDDILTTGGSLLAMLPAIEAHEGDLRLAMVIADRSGGLREVTSPASGRTYPADALWTLEVPTWEPGPATCPACAAGTPIAAPGVERHHAEGLTPVVGHPVTVTRPSPHPGRPPPPICRAARAPGRAGSSGCGRPP